MKGGVKNSMKKKIIAGIIIVMLLGIGGYITYVVQHFYRYNDYKKYLSSYEAEKGSSFTPIREDTPDVPGMVLAAENENYKLYTDVTTTQIALWDKKEQKAVYSNPQGHTEEDEIAINVNRSELMATLNVEYYTADKRRASTNNYDLSVAFGQVEKEKLENGIRYIYTLEDPEKSFGVVPEKISEERMQELVIDKLDSPDARQVTKKYKLKDGIYLLQEEATKNKIGMEKLEAIFEKAGYTADDYAVDMDGVESEQVSFTIPMEYRLTEEGLEVSIPGSEIEERGGSRIYRLELLKFFGAAGQSEEGNLFVPNGSGALIHFNNGKQGEAPYNQYIYGTDPVSQSYEVVENAETARMPVFGIENKTKGLGIFAVIQDGDALASVQADVSGRLNAYNYVYPEFSAREMELLTMFGATGQQSNVARVENDLYKENFKVLYMLLPEEKSNYSGMANRYRDYLTEHGMLREAETENKNPFFLDILTGVETKEHFLGIAYNGLYPMTTFEEAKKITDTLHEAGIGPIDVSLKGWFNGGVYHDVPNRVKIEGALGGKSGLLTLDEKLRESGDRLSLDIAFQKVTETSRHFSDVQEGSKYYSGYVVALGRINPKNLMQTSSLGYEELGYVILSPKYLPRYTEGFLKAADGKIGAAGLTLRDLGDVLASDKKRSNVINRQDAKEIVAGALNELKVANGTLTVAGGNAYSWKVADAITEAPLGATAYRILDEGVPFYEMIVHGHIPYSGRAWNLQQEDEKLKILKYIEYGAMPKFTLAGEGTENLKYTALAEYSSVTCADWKEKAADIYRQIAGVLDKVAGAEMTSHESIGSDLKKITYSNGTTIYVNYGKQTAQADGVTVDAGGYLVKED